LSLDLVFIYVVNIRCSEISNVRLSIRQIS